MDIRTKLALALVSVSLLSMLFVGSFAYQTAAERLRQVSERQLDALAESKRSDLNKVLEGWRDRVELVRRLMVLIVCWVTIGKRIGLAMLAGYVIYLGGLYRDSM